MGESSSFSPRRFSVLLLMLSATVMVPLTGYADVASILNNMRDQLTQVVLPLLSVIGIALASVSFYTGNPNAKQHIVYAIIGCLFGFGAQQIVDWLRGMARY